MRRNLLCFLIFGLLLYPANINAASILDYEVRNTNLLETSEELVVATSDEPVFLYENISEDGKMENAVAVMKTGYVAYAVEEGPDWYHVVSGTYTGFIPKDGITSGENAVSYAEDFFSKSALVEAVTCFIYQEMDPAGYVIDITCWGERLAVIESYGDFLLVVSPAGYEGYVSAEDVALENVMIYAEEIDMDIYYAYHEEELFTVDDYNMEYGWYKESGYYESVVYLGEAIVNYAMSFLGNPYEWGGTDLEKGIDCSAFIMRIYEHFNVSLPRTSLEQRSIGLQICEGYNESKMLPGDILCYDGHVSMYVGDGKVIHAAGAKEGIILSSITYREPICVRRVLPPLFPFEDIDLLYRIVEAEAGNQDFIGKQMVASVVLNRVYCPKFPNTIEQVIFANKQFSPVANGMIYEVEISEETISAVESVLRYGDEANGALYFMNPKYADPDNINWFEQKLTFLFTHGNHDFYK